MPDSSDFLTSDQIEFITNTVESTYQRKIPTQLKRTISAEDIAQNTLLRLIENPEATRKAVDKGSGHFELFTKTVAKRVAIDLLRESTAKKRTPENGRIVTDQESSSFMILPMIQGDMETPSRIYMKEEVGDFIRKTAERELSPHELLIFDLKYNECLENSQIADLIDQSESSVRSHDYRLRKKISVALAATPEFESQMDTANSFRVLLIEFAAEHRSTVAAEVQKVTSLSEEEVQFKLEQIPFVLATDLNHESALKLSKAFNRIEASVEVQPIN